jgi:hypothetical protein
MSSEPQADRYATPRAVIALDSGRVLSCGGSCASLGAGQAACDHAIIGAVRAAGHLHHRSLRDCQLGRSGDETAALVGGHRAGGLCDLRLAGEFQARDRRRRSALRHQSLVLSRPPAGVSAGDRLVGAVLL